MAEKINTMPKVVASTTLSSPDGENTTVVDSDLEGAVRTLKGEDGGPVLIAGSPSIVQTLLAAGLVDEINLQVFPLMLGSGMRAYPETSEPVRLELISSRALPNGVVLQSHRVVL